MLLSLALAPLAAALSAPPQVVATTPTLALQAVPPGDVLLQVAFDQPMRTRGFSFCGGGPRFPQGQQPPQWLDDRTLVWRVRLEPQRTYTLSLNCGGAHNFVSADGEPLKPWHWYFTTGSGTTLPVGDARNLTATKELRRLLTEHYSYLDRTGTDWDQVFRTNQDWLLSAPDVEEWAWRAAVLLQPAQDKHLRFRLLDGGSVATFWTGATEPNWNDTAVAVAFPSLRREGAVTWGRNDTVGYLAIDSWNFREDFAVLEVALSDLRENTEALILDVRRNGGGSETDAQWVAGWFLEEGRLYARHRMRDPEAPGGWREGTRYVRAQEPPRRYARPVFVLQGPICLSSNEAFLLMMKRAPRAISLGAHSGGSSANPRSFDLPNGVQIVVPRWQSLTPEGEPFEGVGIAPDVLVEGDFRAGDPVLDEALRRARASVENSGVH